MESKLANSEKQVAALNNINKQQGDIIAQQKIDNALTQGAQGANVPSANIVSEKSSAATRQVKIRKGDTPEAIERKYGLPPGTVAKLNKGNSAVYNVGKGKGWGA